MKLLQSFSKSLHRWWPVQIVSGIMTCEHRANGHSVDEPFDERRFADKHLARLLFGTVNKLNTNHRVCLCRVPFNTPYRTVPIRTSDNLWAKCLWNVRLVLTSVACCMRRSRAAKSGWKACERKAPEEAMSAALTETCYYFAQLIYMLLSHTHILHRRSKRLCQRGVISPLKFS